MEGEFDLRSGHPNIKIRMMYSHKDSGSSFGFCDVQAQLLMPDTMEAFQHFLNLAERDFGSDVLGGGATASSPDRSLGAESPSGLGKGLGEG